MMKRFLLSAAVLAGALFSASGKPDIVVLYDNDVHCALDGYALISNLKKNAEADGDTVLVVSSGDFVQGGSLGAVSRGGYVVDVMNSVGYDIVTLGNHEFDYSIPRLMELADTLSADVVDCNLIDLRSGERLFSPYSTVDFGRCRVAFIGISTPYSFASSTPAYFQDEDGNYIYSLCTDTIYDTIQNMVDDARESGADFVVALAHLGTDVETDPINSIAMISSTSGIDVVLDGHSHTIIPGMTVSNKDGQDVLLTSTGSHFENIGRLVFEEDGNFCSELIPASTLKPDGVVSSVIDSLKSEYASVGERRIGDNAVLLRAKDDDGNWIVRNGCSALGDFCADAYRIVMGSQIGCVGGGSLRSNLPAGEITFNSIYSVFPFGNGTAKACLSGQKVLDMLEFAYAAYPDNFGGFLHLSGVMCDVDSSVESPVVVDADRTFVRVDVGPRRVSNVRVLDSTDGEWKAIDPLSTYSVAASDYILISSGDGYAMFDGCDVERCTLSDVELLEEFITVHLGGTIPSNYSETENRVRIVR